MEKKWRRSESKLTTVEPEKKPMKTFRGKIDKPCLKIWRSAMPIGTNAKGGLMKSELNFGSETYREDIARSNLNIKPIIKAAGWDLLGTGFACDYSFHWLDWVKPLKMLSFGFEQSRMNIVKTMEFIGLHLHIDIWQTFSWHIFPSHGALAGQHILFLIRQIRRVSMECHGIHSAAQSSSIMNRQVTSQKRRNNVIRTVLLYIYELHCPRTSDRHLIFRLESARLLTAVV